MQNPDISPEMRLFNPDGQHLYLTAQVRERLLEAAKQEGPENQMYCQVLNYTGCRSSEALGLILGRILMEEQALVFRSLKKKRRITDAERNNLSIGLSRPPSLLSSI